MVVNHWLEYANLLSSLFSLQLQRKVNVFNLSLVPLIPVYSLQPKYLIWCVFVKLWSIFRGNNVDTILCNPHPVFYLDSGATCFLHYYLLTLAGFERKPSPVWPNSKPYQLYATMSVCASNSNRSLTCDFNSNATSWRYGIINGWWEWSRMQRRLMFLTNMYTSSKTSIVSIGRKVSSFGWH